MNPEQAQVFTPTPGTYSAVMYYRMDPFTKKKILLKKTKEEKRNKRDCCCKKFWFKKKKVQVQECKVKYLIILI